MAKQVSESHLSLLPRGAETRCEVKRAALFAENVFISFRPCCLLRSAGTPGV